MEITNSRHHPTGTFKPGGAKAKQQSTVPKVWFDEHVAKHPDVCMQYAYLGYCKINPAGETCERNGKVLRHTCVKCNFAKGKHAIKEGAGCP